MVAATAAHIIVLEQGELRAGIELEHVVPEIQVAPEALRIAAQMVGPLQAQVQYACAGGKIAVDPVPGEAPYGPSRLIQPGIPHEIPTGAVRAAEFPQVRGPAQMAAHVPEVLGL
jgi:hypothetical protein